MSVQVKAIAKNIGLGIVGSTVSVTGAGFTPKAVLVFATQRTETSDTSSSGDSGRMMGFGGQTASGIKQRSLASISTDAQSGAAANEQQRISGTDLIAMIQTGFGDVEGRAQLTAFTGDGCTLTIVDQFAVNIRFLFLFIGGTDILNVEIGTMNQPLAVGTTDITGLGFTPELGKAIGFMLSASDDAEGFIADSDIGIGAFVRPTEQGVLWSGANDGPATSQTMSYCNDVYCLVNGNTGVSVTNRRQKFTSWITNGFRLTSDEVSTEAVISYWMIINGGAWAIRPFATSTVLNNEIQISGVGIGTPKGGLVFSHMNTESGADSPQDNMAWSVGIFDSPTSRYAVGLFHLDASVPSKVGTRIEHDAVMMHIFETGGIVGLMDLKTVDSDGVTFVQDDADTLACFGWTVLVGDGAGPGENPPGTLTQSLTLPSTVLLGHDLYLAVLSTGHTNLDPVVTVTDNDTTGNAWTFKGSTSDRKMNLFHKKATSGTAQKTITINGGLVLLASGVAVIEGGAVDDPTKDLIFVNHQNILSLTSFTPTYTDSMLVVILFGLNTAEPTVPSAASFGTLTRFFQTTNLNTPGGNILMAGKAQDGGPSATGAINWSVSPVDVGVARFTVKPKVGEGAGWTTVTLVDAQAEQESTERPLFGSVAGGTYSVNENIPDLTGEFLSKVYGKDWEEITLDRVAVEASADVPSTWVISFTTDGGATYSPELPLEIGPSRNGIWRVANEKPLTVGQFQFRLRPTKGNAIIHKVALYVQKRGRAA